MLPMRLNFAAQQVQVYKIATPVYEGPLDLLLQLIERAELDITKLALAQVTDQYLEHLRTIQERAAEEVSAFLVIAARLLQIKSEALLPRPPVLAPGEEDAGEALARQLLAYKRYKEIAEILHQRQAAGLRTYLRLAPPPKVQGRLDLSGFNLADLVEMARQAFGREDTRPELKTVVRAPRITIREKIGQIISRLRSTGGTTFRNLVGSQRTRLDVVVTFLAMLELVKRHFVEARQEGLFGEIDLQPAEAWDEQLDFELEFGE
jgi:segregation and condensation protein A